jgi:hypothetical protein
LGGDPWGSAPAAAPQPVVASHDPFEALATRQHVPATGAPTHQMANLSISHQSPYAPTGAASSTSTASALALDPFAPIPVGRSTTQPVAAPRPAPSSSGFLDGTEW